MVAFSVTPPSFYEYAHPTKSAILAAVTKTG
jgi:hypothetical protein